MPVETVHLIAALVTTTLLGYAGAIALAGVHFLAGWRSPQRNAAMGTLLQYAGTVLALLGLVYREQDIGTVGLLMVILSVLVADIRRASFSPRLEVGLTVLAVANLLAVTAHLAA